jgi:dissimilatory sulfite reductase (desulfoviridin) alpha/beta subunit
MNITTEEKLSLKNQGFIPQRDGEYFACRVITENGFLDSSHLRKVSEIAEKYGKGEVCFTVRLTVEIPWIKYNDIDNVKKQLATAGLYSGGTGSRIRPIVACKSLYCKYGFINTKALAEKIHKMFYLNFYNQKLPHKFKIAIGGCPNNCIKPDLNDISIVGQRVPAIQESNCKGCKKCEVIASCKMGALTLIDGKVKIDSSKCNNCGVCIKAKCNFNAISCAKEGVTVFIGGKWGKVSRRGDKLPGLYSINESLSIIEKAILYYNENGNTKERFGDMIDRIGRDVVIKKLINTPNF